VSPQLTHLFLYAVPNKYKADQSADDHVFIGPSLQKCQNSPYQLFNAIKGHRPQLPYA
jgi:hypothetical protein